MESSTDTNDLFLLAINLTRRCNLACDHCYLDAHALKHGSADELTTDEVKGLLDEVATHSQQTMVVLTGGEPLLRRDLTELVEHGSTAGLSIVVGTNGVMLNEKRARELQTAGVMGVGISVDSLDPAQHDAFRGRPGAWEKTLAGMDACRKIDLAFQVHFSVTEANAHEIEEMIQFARSTGAKVLNIFFLICTGRGESMSDITAQTYEQVLKQLVEAQNRVSDLIIRARCAPHFKRIAYQIDPESLLTKAQGYEGGGCPAGTHYCRVTPEGGITACPYIPDEEANIRTTPFWETWQHSPGFQQLRNPQLKGKCGECEYQKLCGGCRARPLALGGDIMDSDDWCRYQPQGGATILPLVEKEESDISWTDEAAQRLTRVPGFLRKMVKKRAESYVRERGEIEVTGEHLSTLSAQRFNGKGPKRPGQPKAADSDASLPWTEEAKIRMNDIPTFLRSGVEQVAEDVARAEGRLEVNVKLLDRLEAEDEAGRTLDWSSDAEQHLASFLADKRREVQLFVTPAMEGAAEQHARKRRVTTVEFQDVEAAIKPITGGVTWSDEAQKRLSQAPDFIRAGIKKAAEFNARREDLSCISSSDLTRFRNRAMMRAVKRMKGFGLKELNFDAYAIAREKVPRLKNNSEADKRFATIQSFVEKRENPGELLGQSLLNQMKAELKAGKKIKQEVKK